MKMLVSAILFVLLAFNSKAQSTWKEFKVDENIAIQFPDTPRFESFGTAKSHSFKLPDSTMKFNVIISQLEINSATVALYVNHDKFWKEVEKTYFKGFKDAENLTIEKTNLFDKIARKYEFDITMKSGIKARIYYRTFFISNRFYIFEVINYSNVDASKNKDAFFNSIKTLN